METINLKYKKWNFKIPKIEMKTFYLAGAILMSVSFIGNITSQAIMWGAYNIGNKISGVVSVCFTLLWMAFFIFLYKNVPAMPQKMVNSPEMDTLLNNLREEDKHGKTK